jgi:DNA-binding NarL/FixJ family response regulator
MGSISREILGRVRESLRAVERMLHTEPVVLIDARGRHWMNSEAKKLLQRRGIREEEFLEWVRLGAVHLQRLSYQDLALHMLRLPGQEVVVLLREGCPPEAPERRITHRERQVLRLLLRGLSNKEIAEEMGVSPGTINSHLDSIYRKLGCSNRLEAAFTALRCGLVLPSEKPGGSS